MLKLLVLLSKRLPSSSRLRMTDCRLEGGGDSLRSFDVGVMPLDDTLWARGKCGYKILNLITRYSFTAICCQVC